MGPINRMRFKCQNDDDDDDDYDYDNKINRIIMGITSMEIDGYFSIFFFTFIQLRQCCVHEPHSKVGWLVETKTNSIDNGHDYLLFSWYAPQQSSTKTTATSHILCTIFIFI